MILAEARATEVSRRAVVEALRVDAAVSEVRGAGTPDSVRREKPGRDISKVRPVDQIMRPIERRGNMSCSSIKKNLTFSVGRIFEHIAADCLYNSP